MRLWLDHFAIAAGDLARGAAATEAALSVPLAPGGRHEGMGTHNRLLGLGDVYLEVIAIEAGALPPTGPRIFGLDRFAGPPRVTNWICRTDDLDAALVVFPQAGRAVDFARGDLRWRMALPEAGALPFDNAFPALIEWRGPAHPAARLPESGCRLRALTVRHPEGERLAGLLAPYLTEPRLNIVTGLPGLSAEVETPSGLRHL